MGSPNIVTKDYMQDPQHFADAFNYYAFDGSQVVRSEELTELGTALKYISVADQDEVASALSKEEGYQIVDINTVRLLREVAKMNIEVEEGEEQVNMCKAFQDMTDKAAARGRTEGRAEELVRLCREFGQSEERILERLMKEQNLTEEQALQYMK